MLYLIGGIEYRSFIFEPTAVWEQILKIFGLCFFGIGGMLFVHSL